MMRKSHIIKTSPKVTIRTIREAHTLLFYYWRTIKENAQWFFTKNISRDTHEKWFINNILDENDYTFIAEDTGLRIPIGTVAIYNIDFINKKAKFGRLLLAHPDYIGKGYGKEITKLAIKVAFEELELDELSLEVMRDNFVAYSLYSKLGFKKILFEEDMTLMRLTKNDYKG